MGQTTLQIDFLDLVFVLGGESRVVLLMELEQNDALMTHHELWLLVVLLLVLLLTPMIFLRLMFLRLRPFVMFLTLLT